MDPNLSSALGCSPAFDLGPYTGAVLLGSFLAMALWGIATMQLILFFASNHPGDSWRLKSLVVWVWTMDTVQKCLIMAANYRNVVSGQAVNPIAPTRVMILTQAFPSLVAVPVQAFFVYRIWRFSNRVRWVFIGPLAPCILFHFVMGFFLTAVSWIKRENPHMRQGSMVGLFTANMTVAAAVDVLLAVGLCAVLWRTYREVVSGVAGLKSGLAMIQRIILLTLNTGIWTALFTILTLAMSIRYPRYLIHVVFCFTSSPVYVNMLLANLNARSAIRESTHESNLKFDKSDALSGRLSSIRIRSTRMPTLSGPRISAGNGSFQVVMIERSVDVDDISPTNGKQSPV